MVQRRVPASATSSISTSVTQYFNILEKHEEDDTDNLQQWYLFINNIMDECLEKFHRNSRLHILYAYIQQEKIKNKYKALFHLMRAQYNKPSI
jgi:hypothetical protein